MEVLISLPLLTIHRTQPSPPRSQLRPPRSSVCTRVCPPYSSGLCLRRPLLLKLLVVVVACPSSRHVVSVPARRVSISGIRGVVSQMPSSDGTRLEIVSYQKALAIVKPRPGSRRRQLVSSGQEGCTFERARLGQQATQRSQRWRDKSHDVQGAQLNEYSRDSPRPIVRSMIRFRRSIWSTRSVPGPRPHSIRQAPQEPLAHSSASAGRRNIRR